MISHRFIFIVAILPYLSDGVKVDVKGSLSLGKDVVSMVKDFVNKNKHGRRSFNELAEKEEDLKEKDEVSLIVFSAFICRELEFCKGDMGKFISQYVIALTKSIENAIGNLSNNNIRIDTVEPLLKQMIRYVKRLLKAASPQITEDNQTYTWIDILKRINAKYQESAIVFAVNKLQGNVQEITEVKTKLTQEIVAAATYDELKFIQRLCIEQNICSNSYEATNALNKVFDDISKASDERCQEFIRDFYEMLPSTSFYYRVSDVTAHEFQTILQDMAYSNTIPSKNVFATIHRIVQARLNAIETDRTLAGEDKYKGRDAKLVEVILSDLDHFYSKHKEPFHEFLADFSNWVNKGGKFRSRVRRIMLDLQNSLALESDDLVYKLVNEVRVFMEFTVDPDN